MIHNPENVESAGEGLRLAIKEWMELEVPQPYPVFAFAEKKVKDEAVKLWPELRRSQLTPEELEAEG